MMELQYQVKELTDVVQNLILLCRNHEERILILEEQIDFEED